MQPSSSKPRALNEANHPTRTSPLLGSSGNVRPPAKAVANPMLGPWERTTARAAPAPSCRRRLARTETPAWKPLYSCSR